jgi:hypothetical protein
LDYIAIENNNKTKTFRRFGKRFVCHRRNQSKGKRQEDVFMQSTTTKIEG